MRRLYAFGALVAAPIASALGLKVTEASASCTIPICDFTKEYLVIASCATDMCGRFSANHLCGRCYPLP